MTIIHLLALLTGLFGAELPTPPESAPYSPEWFYRMAFADGHEKALKRGLLGFAEGDYELAWSQTVGTGVKGGDLVMAQGAIELAKGAEALLEKEESLARGHFLRCQELSGQAMAMAEYQSQVMRSAVLRARCESVLPDREAAVRTLQAASKELPDPADAQEFLFGAGRLAEDLGRLDTAQKLFGQALAAKPSGTLAAEALLSLALVDIRRGDHAKALTEIVRMRTLAGDDASHRARARVLEGRALLAVGDTAKGRMRFQQVGNALSNGDTAERDSSVAAESYWRLGDLVARQADRISFDSPDKAARTLAHAQRRELMDEAFGYWYQSMALMEYPWTALSIRDIGAAIERYADAVAHQLYDARSDTDKAASEIILRKKLPPIFQSAGRVYKRQIMLARRTGDGMGIGMQSGEGLARTWWQAARSQREAARLIQGSLRPKGNAAELKWYESQIDSAVRVELWRGRKAAGEGLQELARWEQLRWPEADSLRAFLGQEASDSVVAIGTRERYLAEGTQAPPPEDFTPTQWRWRILEARRQQRETVLDIRVLRARLEGK